MQTNAVKIKINHHRADTVSMLRGSSRSELAFFSKGEWIQMGDVFLQGYWDGLDSHPVYVDIPNWLVDAFIDHYRL